MSKKKILIIGVLVVALATQVVPAGGLGTKFLTVRPWHPTRTLLLWLIPRTRN